MDEDDRLRTRTDRNAPGMQPTLKVFIPYLLLAVVIGLAMLWIYVLGPAGESEDRGQLLHLGEEQTIQVPAEEDTATAPAQQRAEQNEPRG